MSEEIFTNMVLSSGVQVTINEVKGLHLFVALSKSKGDSGLMIKQLLAQSVRIYGKLISEDELDELPACDLLGLIEIVTVNLGPGFKSGI